MSQIFRLDEEFGEGLMGIVGRRRRQDHLGVRGDFNLSGVTGGIGN
jgi:hypothetical protein